MPDMQIDDIGTIIRLTITQDGVALDISSATATKDILLKKPSGTLLTKGASFTTDGTDGKLEYVTVADDVDESGEWKVQASLVLAAGTFRSAVARFDVGDNL